MYLALDSHEQEIANAAAAFLRAEFPLARLHARRDDDARLAEFSTLGWFGLAVAEERGGSGLGVIEQMLFFLELGRVAGPFGVLPQALALQVAADEPELLRALLAGEENVALLVERDGSGVRGLGGDNCRYALELTAGESTLFRLAREQCDDVPCLDRSVVMFKTPASALQTVARVTGDGLWLRAQVCVSAMLLGAAASALDMITGYAKERETFGRPIGAYQAVRHPCADMAVRVESARCQLYYAAAALAAGHDDAALQVAAARLVAQHAARANTDANIQLHGGIGVTDEFSAHLLLKRANLLWRLFGSGRDRARTLLQVDDLDGAGS